MKNAMSDERLSSTEGRGMVSKVRNFLSPGPLHKRRTASLPNMSDSKTSSLGVFGVPLLDLLAREGREIPLIVAMVTEFIEREAMDEEGIYRVNGNAKIISSLKVSFNKHNDVNFREHDVASITGLLKLFLRELPDPLIPNHLLQEFVELQQAHPGPATVDALDHLRQSLKKLPRESYRVLEYLIRHLNTVAQHSDKNKMTAVSLSIVIGPNVFRCCSGLEGLRQQGYTNSVMCKMIQHVNEVFASHSTTGRIQKQTEERKRPSKPLPYSEYAKEKKIKTGELDAEQEGSFLERSIDEAVERSSDTVSPSPLTCTSEDTKEPYSGVFSQHNSRSMLSSNPGSLHAITGTNESHLEGDNEGEFKRRYAKRGMKFQRASHLDGSTVRPDSRSSTDDLDEDARSKSSQKIPVNSGKHHHSASGKAEDTLRTPSPFSWQSSPGTSPPTSPALASRSSKIIGSVVEDSVKQFLLHPLHSSSNGKVARADVYALLLPESSAIKTLEDSDAQPQCADITHANSSQDGSPSVDVKLRGHMRKNGSSMNSRKLRNRRSALHGQSNTESHLLTDQADSVDSMDVEVVTVTIGRQGEGSSEGVQSKRGRISDLVRQLDETPSGSKTGDNRAVGREHPTYSENKQRTETKILQLNSQSVGIGAGSTVTTSQSVKSLTSESLDDVSTPPRPSPDVKGREFDVVESTGTLHHLTLTRPKVPSRRLPSKYWSSTSDAAELKQSASHSEGVSEPDSSAREEKWPDLTSLAPESCVVAVKEGWTEDKDRRKSRQRKTKQQLSSQRTGETHHPKETDSDNPLKDVLARILYSLEEKRRKSGRPVETELMTSEELLLEKQAIQKALLQYEKHYGRPKSREDKEVMRPLYDKYRLVKKLVTHGTSSVMEAPGQMSNVANVEALTLTSATLPSVTLLQPAFTQSLPLQHSLPVCEGPVALSQSAHEPPSSGSSMDRLAVGREHEKKQMSERDLKKASLYDLQQQYDIVLCAKKELRKVLKEYESGFRASKGRAMTREDRAPMQKEYGEYHNIKANLKFIEILMKKHPHKTV